MKFLSSLPNAFVFLLRKKNTSFKMCLASFKISLFLEVLGMGDSLLNIIIQFSIPPCLYWCRHMGNSVLPAAFAMLTTRGRDQTMERSSKSTKELHGRFIHRQLEVAWAETGEPFVSKDRCLLVTWKRWFCNLSKEKSQVVEPWSERG